MSVRSRIRGARVVLRPDVLEDRVVPSFTTASIFTSALSNPGSVAVGDLSGDGVPDLAMTNYGASGDGHTVSVFFNNGSGGFAATPDYTLDTGAAGTTYLTIAEVNGDTKTDIVALSAPASGNSKVTVFTNKGGTTGFNTLTPVDSGGTAGAWLAVGDLNADNKPDVVVANGGTFSLSTTGNNVVVLTNDGTGVLTSAQTLTLPGSGLFGAALPRGVAVVDVDSDGKSDIIAIAAQPSFAGEANSTLNVFLNTGSGGSLSFGTPVASDTGGLGIFGLAVGDFNSDTKPDVVVAHGGTTSVGQAGDGDAAVLLNTSTGAGSATFGGPNVLLTGRRIFAVTVADFNADTKPDFAAVEFPNRSGNGPLHVYMNNGSGTVFLSDTQTTTDTGIIGPQFINAADFDGDAKPDLVVVGENNQAVTYRNGTSAPPSAPTNLSATPGNAQVALTWNTVAGATTYSVYRGTSAGGETLLQSGLVGTTFTNTGLTNGTTYFYQVTATNAGGESARSNEVSGTPQAPPSAPSNLNAAPGNAQVTLTWNSVASAGTYSVYRGTSAGGETLFQSGLTGTTFTNTGLTNGTTYYYQVTAVNVGGESARSNEASAIPQGPPSAPTNLNATPGNAQVALTWNSVGGASTYRVYRGTSAGGETLFQSGLSGTTFTDTGLSNGTTYFYQVTSTNAGGESARSNEASGTPQAPPSAPTNLNATPGNAQVALTWNTVAGATTYSVYRGTSAGTETLLQSGLSGTTFTNTGLTNGTTYFYQVTAVNIGGESARSNESSATPQGPPAAPANLAATPGNAQVALTWNSVAGAATYNVYRGTTAGSETLLQAGLSGTTFTNTGLANGTTYFYQVTAVNGGGESARSNEASATPQAPPSSPTNLAATPGNAQVVLTWNTVAGASSYSVYRGTSAGTEILLQAGIAGTTFTNTGLTNGTTYFYQVTAVNVGGESARSNEASGTPQAPATPPSAPTSLSATPGNAQVALSWNSVVGATSYSVFRGTSAGGETLFQSGLTGTTFTNTGLTNGTTYFYQVTATNVSGESGRSNEASATPQSLVSPPVTVPPNIAVGSDVGVTSTLKVYSPAAQLLSTSTPFGLATGGVRTADADFTGDGTPDVAIGTGPGSSALVKVLDGKTGQVVFEIAPFEVSFTFGVFMAAGDVTGDGIPDLIVTPDQNGGPRVTVFRGGDFAVAANYFGIKDPSFRGGARAAAGDLNKDGFADIVVSAGFSGGPRTSVWDGKSLVNGQQTNLVPDFFLFEPALRNGAYVAVGDVNGDGFADIIGGAGPGGGPRVLVISGHTLLSPGGSGAAIDAPLANFFGGNSNNRGGVRVTTKDLDGDNKVDIVVGAGEGGGNGVTGYLGKNFAGGSAPEAFSIEAFPGFNGGVFVG